MINAPRRHPHSELKSPLGNVDEGSSKHADAKRAWNMSGGGNDISIKGFTLPSIADQCHASLTNPPQKIVSFEERLSACAKQDSPIFDADPYVADPVTTVRLADFYFTNVNDGVWPMFPRDTFMVWLASSRDKDRRANVMLYAMLAVGSLFADRESAKLGQKLAGLARARCLDDLGQSGLIVTQTRLILGIYSFIVGDKEAAGDFCSLAIRVIHTMQYNHEECCLTSRQQQESTLEDHLSMEQLAECRRRTSWTAYLLDIYNTLDAKPHQITRSMSSRVRLPCPNESFEEKTPSQAPLCDVGRPRQAGYLDSPTNTVCAIAWLIELSVIWKTLKESLSSLEKHSDQAYRNPYEELCRKAYVDTNDWSVRLPDSFRYSEANLRYAIRNGTAGVFLSCHSLSQHMLLRVNRRAKTDLVPDLVERNTHAIGHHARRLLDILDDARTAYSMPRALHFQQVRNSAFILPLPGHVTLTTLDISAGGSHPIMKQMIGEEVGGLTYLFELAKFGKQQGGYSALHLVTQSDRRI